MAYLVCYYCHMTRTWNDLSLYNSRVILMSDLLYIKFSQPNNYDLQNYK